MAFDRTTVIMGPAIVTHKSYTYYTQGNITVETTRPTWEPETTAPTLEVYVLVTGAGNLNAQGETLRILDHVRPKLAFFVGVAGGIKDSEIGDVVYSTKVYYVEGGKEEMEGIKSRPDVERTTRRLEQLARRVAQTAWQAGAISRASPAVFASGEKVLGSTASEAATYQRIKNAYNDAQVVDMEAFGFLSALRESDVKHKMIIRGVSDLLDDKTASDQKGNQPLAANNATNFLFALLGASTALAKSNRKKFLGII